ncbi:hypothetical protein EC9_50500 [Rosistilla ulvae]|uniref:Uncharacterized protein n=1 Tax=Rosistilla ulvae TaxID=1930277 RepID=A0A517M7H0_9BACT|nr:hypothetical protein [Rosistilla ulvae]QDS90832.1 hypothetical protein EC9_50500 [Rosistilla ulvae]
MNETNEIAPTSGRPDRFVAGVRRAASRVLGTSPVGERVLELCDRFEAQRAAILQTRAPDAIIVGVVGPTGQGKTWLVRQFIEDASLRQALPSGDRTREATVRIAWVGPYPPADINDRYERYLHCEAEKMFPLGVEYLILDTPGATDQDPHVVEISKQTLSLASVQILVVRRDQLRSQVVHDLVNASEGTLVLPVINIVRQHDDKLSSDIDAYCAAIHAAAPSSEILPPVIVHDFDVVDDEASIARTAREAIGHALRPRLVEAGGAERRQRARLAAADRRFRQSLHEMISDELPYLVRAVDHLHEAADRLPVDVANSLVGSGGSLRAGIRSRLRLALLTDTAAIWFPYKTLIGLLNLTHGAWDRLVLSLSGSLPSLISSAWTTATNIGQMQSMEAEMRGGVRERSAALVRDRLGPLIRSFQQELGPLNAQAPQAMANESHHAHLRGIDQLQHSSQQILEEEIDRGAIGGATAQLLGLVGTLIFWALFAGPVVGLYSKYFRASSAVATDLHDHLEQFPAPELAMLLTSVLLSVMPTAVYAMLVITMTQSNRRVQKCASKIHDRHSQEIVRLQREGVLRLELDDPILADAEFLVRAGKQRDTA